MQGEQPGEVTHFTTSVVAVAAQLPSWAELVRAPNPGPMTLDGTNTWVLRAPRSAGAVVVDPGPADDGHLRAVADRGPVAAVLVTHGHHDHVGGVETFADLTGRRPTVLPAGEAMELAGLRITCVATPGHTADSVCYLVETLAGAAAEPAVLTGDTILGRGTTVVAWPDGDLGDYLASLRLLAQPWVAVPPATGDGPGPALPALPGHGPALADCAAAAACYLSHREARLAQVRAARAVGATAAEVVARVYPDIDPSLREAAEWSVRAQLAFLDGKDAGRESSSRSGPLDSQ